MSALKERLSKWTKSAHWKREALSWTIALTAVFAFRSSIAEPYVVPTGSMEPTILVGDRLWVSKFAYGFKLPFTDISLVGTGEPQRGDVVVFRYPRDPSINYVKRLVGLPGDVLEVRDGELSVNGQKVPLELRQDTGSVAYYDEKFGAHSHVIQRLPHFSAKEVDRYVVPQGYYFFMGDNRDNSNDSRFWGFVPKSSLKGKAIWIWLSLDWNNKIAGLLPSVRWSRFGDAL